MLKYSHPQVVFMEVPGEISLALSISGCPLRCEECHSKYTYNPKYGKILDTQELDNLISKHITCVLFYGGEWQPKELLILLKYVRFRGIKTCLYSGHDLENIDLRLLPHLDFIKVGAYKKDLGGLQSPNTNQRFYQVTEGIHLIDKTEIFYKKPA